MRRVTCVALVFALLLVGCGEQEEIIEEPYVPLSTQAEEYILDQVTINSVGDYTGYVYVNDNTVEVHPYYDLPENIVFRVITISDQEWWKYWTRDYERIDCGSFEMFQTEVGITYGYQILDNNTALYCYTDSLPMGYLKLYMSEIWLSDI